MRDRQVLLCVSIGGLVTLPAALLAVASGGAGHGNYLFARVLLPYTVLLTRLTHDTVTLPLIVLGLTQFPLYGAVVGLAASRGRAWLASTPSLADPGPLGCRRPVLFGDHPELLLSM